MTFLNKRPNQNKERGIRSDMSTMGYEEQARTPTFFEQGLVRESELPHFAPPDAGYPESEYWIQPPFGLDFNFDSPIFSGIGGGGKRPYDIVFMAWTNDCFTKGEESTLHIKGTYPIVNVESKEPTIVDLINEGGDRYTLTVPESQVAGYVIFDVEMVTPNNDVGVPPGKHGVSRATARECSDTCECLAVTIGYTTQQMAVDGTQTLSVVGDTYDEKCHTWEITSGGGSLGTVAANGDVIYTAPSSNAECANNPTISLKCDGVVMDTLDISVNASAATNAVRKCYDCTTSPTNKCWTYFDCDGGWSTDGSHDCGGNSNCPGTESWVNPYHTLSEYGSCVSNDYEDIRTAAQKTAGCCPEQLL